MTEEELCLEIESELDKEDFSLIIEIHQNLKGVSAVLRRLTTRMSNKRKGEETNDFTRPCECATSDTE
jgi:3,4-dihydroxy-2-butanone 4-phosphate synthase